jgi:hypothetical protein
VHVRIYAAIAIRLSVSHVGYDLPVVLALNRAITSRVRIGRKFMRARNEVAIQGK